jgi:hypothetical protein
MTERKPDQTRGWISFGFVVILGWIIGIFIRNVRIGLIIGLALGFLGSSFIRRR